MNKKIIPVTLSAMLSALCFFGAMLFALSFPAQAQQAGKVYRIGFLTTGSPNRTFKLWMAAFRQGLKKLGYVEGKNVVIEERYAKGRKERLSALASELIRLKVDVFVVHSSAPAWAVERAAKKAGRTIPIVFAVSGAPVEEGLVASLARPGGNITGLSDSHFDVGPKRLELLKEIAPSVSRIAVMWNPNVRSNQIKLRALQAVPPALGLTLVPLKFGSREDLDLGEIFEPGAEQFEVLGDVVDDQHDRRFGGPCVFVVYRAHGSAPSRVRVTSTIRASTRRNSPGGSLFSDRTRSSSTRRRSAGRSKS
ncbi:MAG: ABC transporter substrate-binding protein [Deltaproteobacteria bacterium]|nr:ABC transporter substrate-binding protein [Deltaproteobacteria bacterium]